MDLQTGLICVGCVCVSVVVIYLTTLISFREKSYDEAIAEARKSNQPIIKSNKIEKKDKKDKKRNKKSKEKDRSEHSIESDKERKDIEPITEKAIKNVANTATAVITDVVKKINDSNKNDKNTSKNEHVGFKDVEFIEVDDEEHFTVSRRSSFSSNDKPSKPILKNENKEKSPIKSSMKLQRSNSFEIIKPKDELELAKLGKKSKHKDKLSNELLNGDVNVDEVNETTVDEIDSLNNACTTQNNTNGIVTNGIDSEVDVAAKKHTVNTVGQEKKVKKSKSSQNKGTTNESQSKNIIKIIDESFLTNDEVQLVINTLLNKQSGDVSSNGFSSMNYSHDSHLSSEWMKKNDPIDILKKQIREKDQQLETERLNFQAAMGRMKELRHELDIEKNKQLTEKTNNERQLQEIHQRYQQQQLILQEQQRNELKSMQAKFQHIQNKLTEERNVAMQRLQDESNRHQTVIQQLETNRVNVDKLNHVKHENDQLRNDVNQYEKHQISLKQSNDDLHRKVTQLDEHIKTLMNAKQTDEYNYQQKLNDLKSQIQINETTKMSMIEELNKIKNKLTTSEQDMNIIKISNEDKINELNKMKKDKDELINKLNDEKKNLTESLLNKDIEINDLKEKNLNIINVNDNAKDKDIEINKLNNDLLKIKELNTNLKNDYDTLKKECDDESKVIIELKSQINTLKNERDELLNKLNENNCKTNDELNKIENKLKDEINERNALIYECGKLLKTQLHTSEDVLNKLKSLIDENIERDNSLKKLNEQLNDLLNKSNKYKDENINLNTLIDNYKQQIFQYETSESKLKTQVDHYKDVLSKADNLLKNLEADAIITENKWQEKINEKEMQLEELRKKMTIET